MLAHSHEIGSGLDVAEQIARRLPPTLPDSARTLHSALVAAAVETARRRGYSPRITHVCLFLPLEVLAFVCRMHRVTAWRNLKPLKELGLLDYRPLKSTLRGETVNAGCLFQVRLNPSAGSRARLGYDDLKHQWRDLQRDVYRKNTAYRQLNDLMQQSEKNPTDELDIQPLLHWTLPPSRPKPPLRSDCCTPRRVDLESVLDVTTAPRDDRNRMVELAAQALAQALADSGSTNFYQRLLWQLLRRFDATGEDRSYSVYLAAQRAATDSREGFARRAGALFQSRLKQADWFAATMAAPPTRVGTKPIKA